MQQIIGGVWTAIFSRSLPPGFSCRGTAVGTAEYYQAYITGNVVSYGDTYRLSFPYLTQLASHPHWVSNNFGNDIQGIAHDQTRWFLSRTEYGISDPEFGVIGSLALSSDLQNSAPNRYLKQAPAWTTAGYTHFGDIAYTGRYIYVSTNKTGNVHGSIGVYNTSSLPSPIGVVEVNPDHGCAWLAYNPKNGATYFSDGDASALHSRYLNVGSSSVTVSFAPADIILHNLEATPNGHIDNLTGGKVSRHGKLWVFSQNVFNNSNRGILYGVDPYSGFVQTRLDITFSASDEEGEGVDITDETFAGSPGVGGQIHLQTLQNSTLSNDRWNLLNFQVSDMARL